MKLYRIKVNGKVYEVEVEAVEEKGGTITADAPAAAAAKAEAKGDKNIIAPISGKVLEIRVKPGETVKEGQIVAVIEAMKLENEIQSAFSGRVAEIRTSVGADVRNKDVIITLE